MLTTGYILTPMQSTAKFLLSGVFTLALGAGIAGSLTLFAQGGARTMPTAKPVNVVPQTPTFRVRPGNADRLAGAVEFIARFRIVR